jgi:hypothetical protein
VCTIAYNDINDFLYTNYIMPRHSKYYETYKGPELTSVCTWDDEVETENMKLYLRFKDFYGEKNNWNCQLYELREVLSDEYLNKYVKLYFTSPNKRIHFFKFLYKAEYAEKTLNMPLSMPLPNNLSEMNRKQHFEGGVWDDYDNLYSHRETS